MAFEDSTPGNETPKPMSHPPPPLEARPPLSREPLPLLLMGIVLFLGVLVLVWWPRGDRTAHSTPVISAMQARMSTYMTQAVLYWKRTPYFARVQVDSMARTTAETWQKVASESDDRKYRALTELNAMALYGVAEDPDAAQRAIQRAIADDPSNARNFRILQPLYLADPVPVTLTPALDDMVDRLSTGGLIRARNYQAAGDTAAAQRALRQGADRGVRVFAVNGGIGLLAVGIVLAALIVALVYWPKISAALRAVRTRPEVLAPWGIGTAFVVVSLHHLLTAMLTVGLGAVAKSAYPDMDMPALLLLSVVATIISVIVVLGGFLLLLGRNPWEWHVFGWQRAQRGMGYGVLTLMLMLPIFWAVASVSNLFFDGDKGTNPLITTLLTRPSLWMQLFLALAAVVMAPLVEETMYRGILFRALGDRLPFWSAALVSGFLFAVVHGQLAAILPITLLGTIFAFLTRRTGSLWASAAAHGTYNGLVTAVLLALVWALGGPGR